MQDAVVLPLSGWENFYVIIGSSAAALTGLQFVVVALTAEVRQRTPSTEVISAFSTPTIVHFCTVLLVSAILSAPWHLLSSVSLATGACGVGGVVYTAVVRLRARRQTDYKPVPEDWLWYIALPWLAYALILVAALLLVGTPTLALFMLAAAALLLLFIGIRNAWDTAIYVAITRSSESGTHE